MQFFFQLILPPTPRILGFYLYICVCFCLFSPIKIKAQLSAQPASKEPLPIKILESSAKEIFAAIQQQDTNEQQQVLTLTRLRDRYYGIYGPKKTIIMLEKLVDFSNQNNIYNALANYAINNLATEYTTDKTIPKEKITNFIATCEEKFLYFSAKNDCNASKYLLICATIKEENLLECKKYLDKAYNEAKKANCYESMVAALMNTSVSLYEKQKDYLKALNTRLQAVHLIDSFSREKKVDFDYMYHIDIYERTANLHYKVNNYDLALIQWQKCLDLLTTNKAQKSRLHVFITNNIGLCHLKMNVSEKAFMYFEKAVELAKITKDTVWVGIASGNIGDLFVAKKEYQKALSYLNEDAKTSIKYKEFDNATKTILQIAECYLNLENPPQARMYLDSTERMLKKHSVFIEQRLSNDMLQIRAKLHKNWLNYYIKTNDKTLSEAYFQSFLAIQDSINKFKKTELLSTTQRVFDAEYEDAQKRIKELENDQTSLKTIIFTIIFTALALIGAGFIRNSRMKLNVIATKNRELIITSQANNQKINDLEIIEEQSKSITASIEYAKIIQQSILPSHAHINKILENKNNYIIYQPKDIVSGDFYWIEQKQDKIIMVLADCTGHGVPGAMMSMLANELLHKKVFQKNTLEPEILLKDIYVMLKKRLNMKETKRYDGMDIAMLVYDKNTKILNFASVGSVCACYVRDNMLLEFPRNKIYVPMLLLENTEIPDFEKFSITLDKPTQCYMFSDGITDQFDAGYRKKFGKKKFLELLQTMQEIPLNQQKHHIETVMNDWRKDAPQTDDMSLLAFQLNN